MCGVIGVIGNEENSEAAKEAFLGLITLQHRGQDAAGILSYDFAESNGVQSFHHAKNLGLVENVFTRPVIESLRGSVAIGHTRYATIGRGNVADVQPFMLNYPYGIGIVHNGNIVNYGEVKQRLAKDMHRMSMTSSDSETILNWLAHHIEGTSFKHLEKAVHSIFENIHGAYSIAGILGEGGLFAFRDPMGIRPLVLGKKKLSNGKFGYMVASETVPLHFMGYEFDRSVQPGELIYINRDLELTSSVYQGKNVEPRPCMFEWVYFSSAESEIENTPVYGARLELGHQLADRIAVEMKAGRLQADLVAPVPDTSRTAASGLAERLGLPYREVLIKNRYIKRTFILNSQKNREEAVDLKLNPVVSEIKGKTVILVDDSIVRGTTSRKIIQLVRRAGAKKVYFVSTCPPIRFPCYYGFDFPEQNELIAAGGRMVPALKRKLPRCSTPMVCFIKRLIRWAMRFRNVLWVW